MNPNDNAGLSLWDLHRQEAKQAIAKNAVIAELAVASRSEVLGCPAHPSCCDSTLSPPSEPRFEHGESAV